MSVQGPLRPEEENELQQLLWSPEIALSPLNFAQANFPWGMKGTPLEKFKGPRGWQRESMKEIEIQIKDNLDREFIGLDKEVLRTATASGRGIGKSADLGMITCWMQSCNIGASTILTANTESQLKSRTMPEVRKWFNMGMNRHWWDMEATTVRPARWFGDLVSNDLRIDTAYYYAMAQLWSEENPDAFAGLHNMNGVLLLMDEASGIPAPIWTVSEGFFTDDHLHRYWMVFSNPRRPTGAFADCFTVASQFWRTKNIDAREVEGTDKTVYESIIARYGENSDEARIEVYGQFPKTGSTQLMGRTAVREAQKRALPPEYDSGAALVLSLDVARYGSDRSIVAFRRGNDLRSIPPVEFTGLSTIALGDEILDLRDQYDPDFIVIDGNGVGGGVIDYLRSKQCIVVDYNSSNSANDEERYLNLRAEAYHNLAEALPSLMLPLNPEILDELPLVEYRFASKERRKIRDKEEMKKELGRSPDYADALAQLFCRKWPRVDKKASRRNRRVEHEEDYDVLNFGL